MPQINMNTSGLSGQNNSQDKEEEIRSDVINISENDINDVDNDIASALAALEKVNVSEQISSGDDADDNGADIEIELEDTDGSPSRDLSIEQNIEDQLEKVKRETEAVFHERLIKAKKKIITLQKEVDDIKQRNQKALNNIEKKSSEEISGLNDRLVRVSSDFQNFQRRSKAKIQEFVEIEKNSLIRDFLKVLENLKRALRSPSDGASFQEGISLIYKQFEDLLSSWGISEIPAMGEMFDPFLHDALERFPSEGARTNEIIDVYETGFYINDKVLKPAKVVVAFNPNQQDRAELNTPPAEQVHQESAKTSDQDEPGLQPDDSDAEKDKYEDEVEREDSANTGTPLE